MRITSDKITKDGYTLHKKSSLNALVKEFKFKTEKQIKSEKLSINSVIFVTVLVMLLIFYLTVIA